MRPAFAHRVIFSSMIKRSVVFFCLVIMFLILSCSPERRLCKKFISSSDTIKILLLRTDYLLKKNLKINYDSLPEAERDSVSLANSVILPEIINSTFIHLIFNGIFDEMKKGKFKVYAEDSITAFIKPDSGSFVFHLIQVELDEYYEPYSVSQRFDTLIYTEDFDLNAISMNLWFEVSKQNAFQEKTRVLFSSQTVSDNVEGYFRKSFFSNEVNYIYKRTDITADDVYQMAANFGASNADYIFDYFMNEYVFLNYKGKRKLKYMHYDARYNRIYQAAYNRFIFM